MQTDLLVQLLEKMITSGRPPDILSREYSEIGDDCVLVIRFEWFTGRVMDFGYSRERYDAAWKRFNDYWQKQAA